MSTLAAKEGGKAAAAQFASLSIPYAGIVMGAINLYNFFKGLFGPKHHSCSKTDEVLGFINYQYP
ncbi:MAG: hypothetical protein AAB131_07340, partial [Actinomycetota bacterium]